LNESLEDYEFPMGMFGAVPSQLPTLIGKVVMLAALLETKVEALTSNLDNLTQDNYAGQGFAVNERTIRKRLKHYQQDGRETAFSNHVRSLLREIDRSLKDRNFVVHGVWPASAADAWWAWKPRRKSKRDDDAQWIEGRTLRAKDLVGFCTDLADLIARTQRAIETSGSLPRRA
jgi:hypothetical protein